MEIDQDNERRKLLGIFPEELWIEILKNCEDDADTMIACSQASVFWRDLLEPRRTIYLFPKVLEILVDQKYLTSRHSADFLRLRLVARNWRLGVNHLLETPPHQKSFQINNYRLNRMNDLAYSFCLRLYLSFTPKTWRKLESEVLPYLDSPVFSDGSFPFPSRTIHISLDCIHSPRLIRQEGNNLRSWQENLSLLEKFLGKAGPQFWRALIFLGSDNLHEITPDQWYLYLRSLVSMMPNLKSLSIINRGRFDGLTDIQEFPQLRMLELLSMEKVSKAVMRSIFAANSHIKICIIRGPFEPSSPGDFDLNRLNDLKSLCVSIPRSEYFQLLPKKWNLKVLKLDLSMHPSLGLQEIFCKLENYKDTLTDLQLSSPIYGKKRDKLVFWESSKTLLCLPKLKRLEIEVRNICTLDFLLGLKSLENLNFQGNHDDTVPAYRRRMAQQINHEKCSDFLKCNVWEKIPSLQKVEIRFNSSSILQSYSRKDITYV